VTEPLFHYPGGKRRAAPYVWRALGDVRAYSEPFAGSAAVLLARPPDHLARPGKRVEVLNDWSGRITNMYRALRDDPATVWQHAQGPRAELDLDARFAALNAAAPGLDERLRADPDWYDARLAAWQLYASRYAPHPQAALGHRERGGRPSDRATTLTQQDIRDVALRLRTGHVMLLCGDWARAVTPRLLFFGTAVRVAGVFLDPPYLSADRLDDLYAENGRDAAAACRAWAAEHGPDPRYRIVLAGYQDEGRPDGWTEVYWASGGGGESRVKERLWLSPHCRVVAADPGRPLNLQAKQVRA
jgi:site-specific DNA-adenine methylase